MKPMVETYKNEDGEVAVLVSTGFGAGWSTWNSYPELAYDKRIVELFMRLKSSEREQVAHGNQYFEWVRQLVAGWGYSDIYWGGFDDCIIEWVPVGTPFRITEYDGAENLEELDMDDWVVF